MKVEIRKGQNWAEVSAAEASHIQGNQYRIVMSRIGNVGLRRYDDKFFRFDGTLETTSVSAISLEDGVLTLDAWV
jgi:hypothetical protein